MLLLLFYKFLSIILYFFFFFFAEDTYRIPVEDITGIPPIPIQPIGFEDAYVLIWFVMTDICFRSEYRPKWLHDSNVFLLVISVSWEEKQLQLIGREHSTVLTTLEVRGSNKHLLSTAGSQIHSGISCIWSWSRSFFFFFIELCLFIIKPFF